MKTKKISLRELQNSLSRDEMKKIMAGSANCGTGCGQGHVLCGFQGMCNTCYDHGIPLPPNSGKGICGN